MEITFGRAIKLVHNRQNSKNKNDNFQMQKTVSLISEKEPSIYDKETSEKIRGFLRAQFDDYSEKTGINFITHKNTQYAITGKEIQELEKINKAHEKTCKKIERIYPEKNRSENASSYFKLYNSEYAKKTGAISAILENGGRKKPNSSLTFETDKNGQLKNIVYYSSQKTKIGQDAICEILTL